MTSVEIFGRVNEEGNLEIEKPQGLHAGKKVKVTITELDEAPRRNTGFEVMVSQQVEIYLAEQQDCPHCGESRSRKGQHALTVRTLFGTLKLN